MVRDKFSISWGDTGSQPPDGDDFQTGEKPDAQHFDWKWYNVINKINAIWDEFTRLDSDDDGIVDEADYANDADASTYKGNDIDSDGDGTVNDAVNVTSTFKGNDIDSDGDGTVDKSNDAINVTSTYKGNDIDTDGDGTVNNADDATNVTATYKNNDIDSDGDGSVNQADNSTKVSGYNVHVGSTAPSNPDENDLWIDTS